MSATGCARLTPGATIALPGQRVEVRVTTGGEVDLFALALGEDERVLSDRHVVFFNNPERTGLTLTRGSVVVEPGDLDESTHMVRVAVAPTAGACPGSIGVEVLADGREIATFACDPGGLGSVLVVEVYRRAGAWKLRALGQGYCGGAAEMLRAHGVEVDEKGARAPGEDDRPPDLDPGQALARARAILESAARMVTTRTTALEMAQVRLDDEVGRLGDLGAPAGAGTGPAAGRHSEALRARDEAVAAAGEHHDRDLAMLEWEQRHLASQWPRAAAGVDSPCWAPGAVDAGCDGWLAAVLHRPEVSLEVPLLVTAAPSVWWVQGGDEHDRALAVLNSVVRQAACRPGTATTVDVVDVSGGLAAAARVLAPLAAEQGLDSAARGVRAAFVTADLRQLACEAGLPPQDHHLLVIPGSGCGRADEQWHTGEEEMADDTDLLVAAAMSVLRTGGGVLVVGPVEDERLTPFVEIAHTVPAAPGELDDPWVGSRWMVEPPAGPTTEEGWAPYVDRVSRAGR